MGMDFKIICEYKENDEWKLLKENIGDGEIESTALHYENKTIEFWLCEHWTGGVLRWILSNNNDKEEEICENSYNSLSYLAENFYKINNFSILTDEYYDEEDIEYSKEILNDFKEVIKIVKNKYKIDEVRLIYVWY